MYVDIASIYTDMCIVIVCDSAQLFHYSNPQKDGEQIQIINQI